MEYPRLVYMHNAATSRLCADAKERRAALAEGWFDTVPEAISGKADPLKDDSPVTVYKEVGGKMESFAASGQEEADMFIQADGWHSSPEAATVAAVRAEWPAAPADVDAIMGALQSKKRAEVMAYAARIGATVSADAKLVDVYAAIAERLKAPAP